MLVVVFILYLGFGKNMPGIELLWVSLIAVALFLSILLHEFGHALMARRFGVETKDIILLPIGGLARLNKLPEKPYHEFLVAIAGPLVNFAIALLLLPYLFLVMAPGIQGKEAPTPDEIAGDYFYFVPFIFAMNIGLAVFNLLPAFPMDGGRILRALLSSWLGKLRATRIAMIVGQVIAAGMVVLGFTGYNYLYIGIGVFIFFAALREFRWVKMEHALSTYRVRDVVRQNFSRLSLTDTLQTAFGLLSRRTEQHFLVFDEYGQYVGTLSGETIFEAAKQGTLDSEVKGHYQPTDEFLNMDHSLNELNEHLDQAESDILPVVENGTLAGVVDREAVHRFLRSPKRTTQK